MTVLDVQTLHIDTLEGRPLVRDLSMRLGREKAAIIGRNGVGKTTLLRTLAGLQRPKQGLVRCRGSVILVAQRLDPTPTLSRGQLRRRELSEAFERQPDLLMLDEPTEDLDDDARAWLNRQIRLFEGALLVVSHDRELLAEFVHFFQVAESGCRYLSGRFSEVQDQLVQEDRQRQAAYARTLSRLAGEERKHHRVQRRRTRKKRVGRVHELDRNQSKSRLNKRRSAAQVSQAKVRAQAERTIQGKRSWAQAGRRALKVELGLALTVPTLPEPSGPVIRVQDVSLRFGENVVLEGINVGVERDRLAVVGPNGSGKSSLVRLMSQELQPSAGVVRSRLERIGFIAQGADDWATEESLLERLARSSTAGDLDVLAEHIVAHRFPLELALRPMSSLSPGERTRAALICLFQHTGTEVLVLDEPTFSLDLVGTDALTQALAAWPGGLVVASHNRSFLRDIGVAQWLELPGAAR